VFEGLLLQVLLHGNVLEGYICDMHSALCRGNVYGNSFPEKSSAMPFLSNHASADSNSDILQTPIQTYYRIASNTIELTANWSTPMCTACTDEARFMNVFFCPTFSEVGPKWS
jgi:hypothetical protein